MEASYLIRATNETTRAAVKLRVKAPVTRDGSGNLLADTDAIQSAVRSTLAAARPASGRWAYSISAKRETFDHDHVTV